ncbi:hypothetical protein ACLB2K_050847 [Fragaria x ananassa]
MANPHEDAELELLDLAQLEEAPPQLVGYLVSDKALNVSTVIRMLRQAWQKIGWTHLEPIQAYHTFSITVENAEVAQILRERSPWSVMGCSFDIHTWPQEAGLKDLPLHMTAFWVQVHNLPRHHLSLQNATTIGSAMGTLVEVEDPNSPEGYRGFLRNRVQIDSRRPLRTNLRFNRGNQGLKHNFGLNACLIFAITVDVWGILSGSAPK